MEVKWSVEESNREIFVKNLDSTGPDKTQLTLKQHGFELQGSPYTRMVFITYIGKLFGNL